MQHIQIPQCWQNTAIEDTDGKGFAHYGQYLQCPNSCIVGEIARLIEGVEGSGANGGDGLPCIQSHHSGGIELLEVFEVVGSPIIFNTHNTFNRTITASMGDWGNGRYWRQQGNALPSVSSVGSTRQNWLVDGVEGNVIPITPTSPIPSRQLRVLKAVAMLKVIGEPVTFNTFNRPILAKLSD